MFCDSVTVFLHKAFYSSIWAKPDFFQANMTFAWNISGYFWSYENCLHLVASL